MRWALILAARVMSPPDSKRASSAWFLKKFEIMFCSSISTMYPNRKQDARAFVSILGTSYNSQIGNNAVMKNRIKELRKLKDLSMDALAQKIGTTRATIMKLESGQMQLTTRWMGKIAEGLGCNAAELLHSETNMKIPVLGYVGAGGEVHPIDDLPLIRPLQLSEADRETLNCEFVDAPPGTYPSNIACVVVKGNSMYPVYKDGEYLFYRRTPTNCNDSIGLDCVVCLEDGRMLVKTLVKGGNLDTFTLDSYNQPPIYDVRLKWCAPVEWTHKKISR